VENSTLSPSEGAKESSITCVVLIGIVIAVLVFCAGVFIFGFLFYRQQIISLAQTATPVPTATPPPTATPALTATPAPTDAPAPTDTPLPSTAPPSSADTPVPESPSADPAPTDTPELPTAIPTPRPPKSMHMNSPEYGMQAFLWWRPETAHRDLELIRDASFTWVKQEFPWREIEGSAKGSFGWERPDRIIAQVEEFGLDLVARIDSQPAWAGGGFPENGPPDNLQDLADFLYAMASRYKGRIRAYQVYNEPNLNVAGRSEWGGRPPNPAEYTELLKVAYQAIKQADPNAMVISAGLSPTSRWDDQAMPDEEFLKGMYAAGAKPYFDVLGVHGAGYKVPPETDPSVVAKDPALNNNDPSPEERKRIYCFRHVEDLRRIMVENGDGDKQIAILEFGWASDPRPDSPYSWHYVTEEQKGDYLVRAYKYAKENWAPWMGLMSLIYVADPDWTENNEQYWWAITYPDYPEMKWRPAYVALKNMPK
jgi:hypothetical protein